MARSRAERIWEIIEQRPEGAKPTKEIRLNPRDFRLLNPVAGGGLSYKGIPMLSDPEVSDEEVLFVTKEGRVSIPFAE